MHLWHNRVDLGTLTFLLLALPPFAACIEAVGVTLLVVVAAASL